MNRIGPSAVVIAAVSGLISCSGQPGAPPTGAHSSVPAPEGSVAHSPAPASRTTPSPSNLLEAAGSGQPDPSHVGREPLLAHSVASFAQDPTGEVDEDFAQALDGCQEYTSTTEGGTSITFRAEPLPFSHLGDHTAAMRLVGKSSHEFEMTVDVVFVAVGNVVSSLLLGATELDPEAVDSAELERLARISVDRIKQASSTR